MDNLTRARNLYLDSTEETRIVKGRVCIICGSDLLYYNKAVCNTCQDEAKKKYENTKGGM